MLKYKKFLRLPWAILAIFVLWIIFSHQFFFFGKVPFPSTYQVNHFPPWSHFEKFWGPVKNGAMPDIVDQIYPWRHFTIEELKQGKIALWNPYSFAGNPHLANFQSAVFSPLNILFFLLPFIDAWSIAVFLQPLLAGIFAYLYLREMRLAKASSLLGAFTYMFCGFMVVWMAYGTLSLAIAFLPLSLLALEKIVRKQSIWNTLLLSFSIAFSFFSGHFQTSFYGFIFLVAYSCYVVISIRSKKLTLWIFLGVLIGLSISLIQLIPSIQLYLYSVRSEIFNTGGGIPFFYLISLIAPDFFGNPVTRNNWFGYYAEWASFIGVVPLTVALFSLQRKLESRARFFVWSTITTLFLAVESFIQPFIGSLHIPVISTSTPSRIIVLTSFSLAILSAFGLDKLYQLIQKRSFRPILVVLCIMSVFIGFVWTLIIFTDVVPEGNSQIALKNFILPTMFFITTSVVIIVAFFSRVPLFLRIMPLILILLAGFDGYRFANKWMPSDPKDLVFQDIAVINAMKKYVGEGRVFGNLGADIDTYYRIPSLDGYDPLYIGRYGEFIRSAYSGEYSSAERSVVKVPRTGENVNRMLDLLSVNLIFHPLADTNQGWAYPVWNYSEKYEIVYQDDKFQLFRNRSEIPRVSLFFDYEVIPDGKKLIKRFYTESFDFRKVLLLEENPGIEMKINAKGSAKLVKYEPSKVIIQTKSDTEGLLFLADNHYPAWRVKVDGKEKKIFRADYTFRGVVIPKGESIVEFYYRGI